MDATVGGNHASWFTPDTAEAAGDVALPPPAADAAPGVVPLVFASDGVGTTRSLCRMHMNGINAVH